CYGAAYVHDSLVTQSFQRAWRMKPATVVRRCGSVALLDGRSEKCAYYSLSAQPTECVRISGDLAYARNPLQNFREFCRDISPSVIFRDHFASGGTNLIAPRRILQ